MAIKMSGSSRKRHQIESHMAGQMKRFRFVWLGIIFVFVVIAIRLFMLQVVDAHTYTERAKKSHKQSAVVYNRGRILDRNGVILAQDTILYDVFLHPRYYYDDNLTEIAEKLSPLLDLPTDEIQRKMQLSYDTISLKKNIDKATAMKIKQLKYQCLDVPKHMIRRYPQGHLASHVIGYVNDDASISTGVEYSAEKTLRMPPKLPDIELNAHGDFVNVAQLDPQLLVKLPKAEDVQLTIDARIQYAAEAALQEGLEASKAKRGTVIVMNPRNGELLAFAIAPDFDPEKYATTEPEHLKNWAITDVYPPGSTFKILTVASGLETGVINRNSKLHDTGFIQMKGFTIKNYDYSSHGAPGDIDLIYLFQHSSNIGSLLISLMMDPTEHHKLLRDFGMGQKTHIDIPGESAGILHDPEHWDQLTHATLGFGYGLAATPIQIAAAVAAIANNGVWVTPHLIQNESNLIKRRVISETTAKTVTDLLAESIETASSSTVRLEGFRVAGKTGTSRKPNENGKGYSSDLFTSFVGYFPADDPKVLIMVVVDSPGVGNAWGSTVAGPIFKTVAQQTAGYLGLEPSYGMVARSASTKSF